jgi:hypothetical protein
MFLWLNVRNEAKEERKKKKRRRRRIRKKKQKEHVNQYEDFFPIFFSLYK